MRTILACLALGSLVWAQSYEERYEQKLKATFIAKQPWVLDYDAARKKAKDSGKVILAYFTRSYAP